MNNQKGSIILLDSLFHESTLVASSNTGKIYLWPNFSSINHSWDAHVGPIYSLSSNNLILISGGSDCIKLWRWSDIIYFCTQDKSQPPTPIHILQTNQSSKSEVNALVQHEGILYAAMGKDCYEWDLASASNSQTFKGHAQSILCLKIKPDAFQPSLFTGSEDGSLRIWDMRTGSTQYILDCEKASVVSDYSSKNTNHISTIDINGDWLACGGGIVIHSWYLPVMQYSSYIPIPSVQTLLYHKNEIISAGIGNNVESNLFSWSQEGKPLSATKTSILSIFSISKYQNGHDTVFAVSGVSDKVDLFSSSQFLPLIYSMSLSV
jgi:THO complex subunit 6